MSDFDFAGPRWRACDDDRGESRCCFSLKERDPFEFLGRVEIQFPPTQSIPRYVVLDIRPFSDALAIMRVQVGLNHGSVLPALGFLGFP